MDNHIEQKTPRLNPMLSMGKKAKKGPKRQ